MNGIATDEVSQQQQQHQQRRPQLTQPLVHKEMISSLPSLTIQCPHSDVINAVLQLRDGTLVSCSDDCDVKRWSLNSGELIETFMGHSNWVNCVAELDDDVFVTGGKDCQVIAWSKSHVGSDSGDSEVEQNKPPLACFDAGYPVFCIVKLSSQKQQQRQRPIPQLSSSSSQQISSQLASEQLSPSAHGTMRLLVAIGEGKMMELIVNEGYDLSQVGDAFGPEVEVDCGWAVWSLCELSDGSIVTAGLDNGIDRWDLDSRRRIQTLRGHRGTVQRLIELRDGCIASTSKDNTIRIWDLGGGSEGKEEGGSGGTCIQTLKGHSNTIYGLVETKDGFIISASYDMKIKVWRRRDTRSKSHDHGDQSQSMTMRDNEDCCCRLGYSIFCLALLGDGSIATGCVLGDKIEVRKTWLSWKRLVERCCAVIVSNPRLYDLNALKGVLPYELHEMCLRLKR